MGRAPRITLALLTAVAACLLGLALVFTDIGPGRSGTTRGLSAAVGFLAAGLAIGLLRAPAGWWWLAVVAASGMILLGVVGVVISLTDPASGDLSLALTFLLGPLATVLVGGYAGAVLLRRRSPAAD